MSKESEKPKRALVLSGGGGRGAYHVGVLEFLEEHDWHPDIVVGTSIGAVNGAALASGHTANSLKALWRRLKTKNVQKSNVMNPLKMTSLLDTNPLRETLLREGWLDFDRINAADPKLSLRITATEISTGQLHVFGNTEDERPSRMQKIPITIEHIISSCSIPLVYPATQLGSTVYWDGAIVANTPLGAAIDAGADEIIVVIMTPYEDDRDYLTNLPEDLLTAVTMMLDWVLLSSFKAEIRSFQATNKRLRLQRMLRQYEDMLEEESEKREIPDPIIVSPNRFMPIYQIINYAKEGHESLFRSGYEDAMRAWENSGRAVEGGSKPEI